MIFEILRPFVNRLTPDKKYFLCNSENLPEPIEMQLSKKIKIFSEFFTANLKSTFYFEHVEQKDESHSLCLSKIIGFEIHAYANV